jgi:hypothetical protein
VNQRNVVCSETELDGLLLRLVQALPGTNELFSSRRNYSTDGREGLQLVKIRRLRVE